jgi:hypothetical protein
MTELPSGADFSVDRQYRYRLWRTWDPTRRPLLFVLLNPSTADGSRNDPTVARCILRAQRLGYGGLEVVNLFAYCATEPRVMKAHADPIGRDNEAAIADAAARAGKIIGGWGNHGTHMNRGRNVAIRLRDLGYTLHHLGVTQVGQPQHPLYVSYDVQPQEFIVQP